MIAKQGQSFLDLVIQATGDVDNAFAMSLENERSMSDAIETGQEIVPTEETHGRIAEMMQTRVPATAPSDQFKRITERAEGIGVMIIESTFIVR